MTETKEARIESLPPSNQTVLRVNTSISKGKEIIVPNPAHPALCQRCMKRVERDQFGDLTYCGEMVSTLKEGGTVYNCAYFWRLCSGCDSESDCFLAGKVGALARCERLMV